MLQELLGHKDVATTQIHTQVTAKPGIWGDPPRPAKIPAFRIGARKCAVEGMKRMRIV
jgi:hypothetical protein